MKKICLSYQCSSEILKYSGEINGYDVSILDSPSYESRVLTANNGKADAYIMIDEVLTPESTVLYCGKETSKSYKLAKYIADELGAKIYGGGESWSEMKDTNMVSAFITIGSVDSEKGKIRIYSCISRALTLYFNSVCPDITIKEDNDSANSVKTEEANTGKEVNIDTEIKTNQTNELNITDEQLGYAVRTLIKAINNIK